MILFLLGLASGLAVCVALVLVILAWDRYRWPECRECCAALPPDYQERLCPRCAEYAAMVKGQP
jgi:hypothetical protein